MRPKLQAYLDGELPFDELPEELRREARRWERLLSDIRESRPDRAPADLEASVLRSLPKRPDWQASPVRRAAGWLVRPRTVRIPPLAGLAAAAGLGFLLLWPRGGPTPSAPAGRREATIYVQFVLEAPSARSVAVAGDFNGWSPELVLSDADGDGRWTGRLPLKPGLHEYMFVIDGSQWVTDPQAERYADDGFGNRNAVLLVTPPSSS